MRRLATTLIAVALIAAACGGSATEAGTSAPATTAATTATPRADRRSPEAVGPWSSHALSATISSMTIDSTTFETTAAGFSALADPNRLRILSTLSAGQQCVCELLEDIDIAPNLLSYHLKVLREAGLVEGSRRGRWVDYRLASDGLDALRAAIPDAS